MRVAVDCAIRIMLGRQINVWCRPELKPGSHGFRRFIARQQNWLADLAAVVPETFPSFRNLE
jgi:hypothetical protein